MDFFRKNKKAIRVVYPQYGVVLEESASELTQGYVNGARYEGSQRYPFSN